MLPPPRPGVVLLNGNPPEMAGLVERTLAWVGDVVSRAGGACRWLLTKDTSILESALRDADAVVVGELRPGNDLGIAARLLRSPSRLILINHGYGFCAIETRACATCRRREVCRNSDRVAIYQELARRADRVVYLSPLHRQASETFVGSYPDKTLICAPPSLPELDAVEPTGNAVAVHDGTDAIEWMQVVGYAHTTARTIDVIGAPAAGIDPPASLRSIPTPTIRGLDELVAAAPSLVCLPGRPIPFGAEAAAFISGGRTVVVNDRVGLASFSPPLTERRLLEAECERGREDLRATIHECLGVQRERRARETDEVMFVRPLLYCHRLGLGDSISLLPFARALSALATEQLLWAMPAHHRSLLEPELGVELASVEELGIHDAKVGRDLVIEVSVAMRDHGERFTPDDILGERWIRIDLARQAGSSGAVHENLVSLLGRCGLASVPSPPRLVPSEAEATWATQLLAAQDIDPLHDLVVTMHPGSGRRYKCWPVGRYAALARWARARLGARILLIGGIGEDGLVDEFLERYPDPDLVLRGRPLRELAAVIAKSGIHVGNDSGLTHLAAACETPTLALFGPTEPRMWAPTHPLTYVVRAKNAAGEPSASMDDLSLDAAILGLRNLLLRVVGEPPRTPRHAVVALPVEELESVTQTFCARLSFDDPTATARVRSVRDAAALPIAWQDLCERVGHEAATSASAVGLVGPSWMRSPGVLSFLSSRENLREPACETPRCAYVIESGYQHLFPVQAMLRELRAPVFTTGARAARRFEPGTDVVCVREQDLERELDERAIDVVISTSHRIKPARLRGMRGRRVVFIGHGESDKVFGQSREARRSFVHHEINDEFDLLAVASDHHMQRYRNPNRRLTGYLKHDLFVHGGYAERRCNADWVLWAPSWGRHSSVSTWLTTVVEATARRGLRCLLHFHPHSDEAEPEIVQRAQMEALRHPHLRIGQCANILDAMSRCALMFGDVSTTCYDWLMFDRPIIFLDHPGLCFEEEKRLFGVGRTVAPGEDLEMALREELAAPTRHSNAREAALRAHFPVLDGHAARRVREAIEELWRARWSAREGGAS